MARPASVTAAAVVAVGMAAASLPPGTAAQNPRPLETARAIPYFIADGTGEPGYQASDRELARWALDAWQRSGAERFRFEEAHESRALVRVYWAESQGGQYGEMRPITVDGRRGAAVYIRPDVNALGDAIARRANADPLLRDTIVYLTCVHELGHALGLAHTSEFEDIMYFFGYGGNIVQFFDRYRSRLRGRSDIALHAGVSERDVARLRELYP